MFLFIVADMIIHVQLTAIYTPPKNCLGQFGPQCFGRYSDDFWQSTVS